MYENYKPWQPCTVKLNIGDNTIFMPRYQCLYKTVADIESIISKCCDSAERNHPKLKKETFTLAIDYPLQILAAAEMYNTDEENDIARKFLNKGGALAIICLSAKNMPLLVRLLRDDVFGRNAVAEAFDVVQSGNGNTMLKAYLLQSLHDGNTGKDIQNIQL